VRISDLIGAEIGLLGAGVEGRATLAALRRAGHSSVVHVLSDAPIDAPPDTQTHVGEAAIDVLPRLQVLVRSPGFAPHHALRVAADATPGLSQTTATRLFLRELRERRLRVIGITGSKGKSTTSTLTHLTLQEAGIASVLVGNVGVPALDLLERIETERLVTVLELSSYQCADLEDGFGPDIACLLDLFPEHLDWHGSVRAYYAAKARIASTQRSGDQFRYNANARSGMGPALTAKSDVQAINTPLGLHFRDGWFQRAGTQLFPDTGMLLPGLHNRQNAVAALALGEILGARPEHLQRVLSTFAGLPFRLQDEGTFAGIRFINDSLSTAPEVVVAALHALAPNVRTLIVGGHSRGLDQTALIRALGGSGVQTLIALPDTGIEIAKQAINANLGLKLFQVAALDQAVALAAQHTPAGMICLFSPGAPSYNRYRSFEERGTHFRTLVHALGRP
jgi:UDP-N-acetylmuramoylalanine--D-glutamate ligase